MREEIIIHLLLLIAMNMEVIHLFTLKRRITLSDSLMTMLLFILLNLLSIDFISPLTFVLASTCTIFFSFCLSEKDMELAVTKTLFLEANLFVIDSLLELPIFSFLDSPNFILNLILLICSRTFFGVITCLWFKKALDKYREKLPQIFLFLTLVNLVLYALSCYSQFIFELTADFGGEELKTQVFTGFFILLFTFLGIMIAMNFRGAILAQRNQLAQLEVERDRCYLEELEKHSKDIRRYHHDWKNMLLSLDYFLKEKDFEGLTCYYDEHIRKSAQGMTAMEKHISALENLKNLPLKSLIHNKLLLEVSADFSIRLEIEKNFALPHEVIPTIVRILGILLDNAVEELTQLQAGVLEIAIFSEEQTGTIIVKNSRRDIVIPGIAALEEEGFSTKGNDRGIGLANVKELCQSHGLLLDTEINEADFVQRLMVPLGEVAVTFRQEAADYV